MNYKVVMTSKANSSFNSIVSHLLELSGGPNTAKTFIETFDKKI